MENIFTQGPPPQSEIRPREPVTSDSGSYLRAVDAGFFVTEEELKDIAAGVAFRGKSVEPILGQIRQAYAARISALDQQFQAVLLEIEAGIEEVKNKIRQEEERVNAVQSDINERKKEKENLEIELQHIDVVIATSLQEIRKLRLNHGKQFFEKQGEYLDKELDQTKQDVLQDIKDRREIAEEIYKLQKDHWEANRDEFERRAQLFEKELNRVENQLGLARKRTAKLHDLGITRTTANFLIWVGYISLAGIGGVIGSFFLKRQAGETDFLSLIFRGFINLVHLTQPPRSDAGSWWIILAPMPLLALVVVHLLIVWAIVMIMDGRLKKFDPTWEGETGGKKARGQRSRSSLLDRFSSYMLTPDVNRKSYRQVLAYFPFIVIGALAIWLFASGIPQAKDVAGTQAGGTTSDPTFGLATAYLGVIFTLLSTSAALLYATKIIEPRWRKFEGREGEKGVFNRYLRLNWEVVVLMLLLVIALALAAVLPLGVARYDLISWGAVAVFMALCSLGLAYGLIQRGLFRDEEYFERKRQIYRHQVEKNRVGPTLYEIFDRYETSDETKSLITNYREAKHLLDEYRMIYELKELFEDDFDEDTSLRKVFGKLWPRPQFSLRNVRLRAMPPGEPRPIDYVIAPEETARILNSRAGRRAGQDRVEAILSELLRMEQERTDAKNRLERLNQEVTIRRRRGLDVKQEYELKKSSLAVRLEKEILKFEAAYAVGRMAYVYVKDELDPPPPPEPAPNMPIIEVM